MHSEHPIPFSVWHLKMFDHRNSPPILCGSFSWLLLRLFTLVRWQTKGDTGIGEFISVWLQQWPIDVGQYLVSKLRGVSNRTNVNWDCWWRCCGWSEGERGSSVPPCWLTTECYFQLSWTTVPRTLLVVCFSPLTYLIHRDDLFLRLSGLCDALNPVD